jgi:glycine/D-amino acid oxidase-like deaminating enzyme
MKIAIIGTGFAGLATGWILTKSGCSVTFFDKRKTGQSASGIAAGLLHPYVGEQTRRSLWATEALAETRGLLKIAGNPILEEGIIRIAQNDEQFEALSQHAVDHGDVELLGERKFLIRSGLVIDTYTYLHNLFQASASLGAQLIQQEITNVEELKGFDQIILAVGHEIGTFFPDKIKQCSRIKGQVVTLVVPEFTQTTIAKGYLAKSRLPGVCHWGATYERMFLHEEANPNEALSLLKRNDFALPEEIRILECKAGVRLCSKGQYIPKIEEVQEGVWWIGAFGSRGLLYHALFARKLSEMVLCR